MTAGRNDRVAAWVFCRVRRDETRQRGYDLVVERLRDILGASNVDDVNDGARFAELAHSRSQGGDSRALLIVAHSTDLEAESLVGLRQPASGEVVEVQFTTEVSSPRELERGLIRRERNVPYCSLGELAAGFAHANIDALTSQEAVNQFIAQERAVARRSRGDLVALSLVCQAYLVTVAPTASGEASVRAALQQMGWNEGFRSVAGGGVAKMNMSAADGAALTADLAHSVEWWKSLLGSVDAALVNAVSQDMAGYGHEQVDLLLQQLASPAGTVEPNIVAGAFIQIAAALDARAASV